MTLLRYRSGDETREVRVEPRAAGYKVIVGGRSFDVELRRSEGPFLDLVVDKRPLSAIIVRDGERRIVKIGDGDPVTVVRQEKGGAGAPSAAGADGRLTAAMDGQVVAVLAKPGDRVEAGAPLVVLEAMKMEIKLIAPFAGRVKTLACAPGDVVRRGRVLVEIDLERPGATGP